ncbi:bifunctional phosphopantothenoylcysteine decarboxylase/phosphopantothenate--cysteine ligase CoaBC [Peribacillus sp. SCS-37]|uniref:bifunctional phosphopantothenoylcysteine decarboxylase/phosphopantothenate--cysteine ligase CoaBC n=1 Tax=Paraperibacillus esterisolvens TaxID=3115296 RepID=UPI003905B74F
MLTNKKILLCVSGGIAVYKAAALTSKLVQEGAAVKVIMSESAMKFVTPLTFQALSRNDVFIDTFDEKIPGKIAHIDLADWADLIIVAPATANIIGKMANGIADDMISTTILASTAPVWIAPAMNVHMYGHPAVQRNMEILKSFGYEYIEPGEGYLACGYVGRGRLEEPETIVEKVKGFFMGRAHLPLTGKRILVTAGPTREKIDPVRFISNFSTGKMGYALAAEAARLGGEVTLVSGPVSIEPPTFIRLVAVESAQEMYEAVMGEFEEADAVIMTAAVSDYRPKIYSTKKMKKQPGDEMIQLERTNDILMELGARKGNKVLIGFAAETDSVEEYAQSKLTRKNADMIVANNVTSEGAGFGTDTNIVTIYAMGREPVHIPQKPKAAIAGDILDRMIELFNKKE